MQASRCCAVDIRDIAGQRFGRLVAVRRVALPGEVARWECVCDCGRIASVRLANLGRSAKSCGCLRVEACKARERRKNHPTHGVVLSYYKRNAKLRGLVWEIPRDLFTTLLSKACTYCGAPPRTRVLAGKTLTFNGIDRIDPAKGYDPANVTACCSVCNHAKNDLTPQQFAEWISKVHTHMTQKVGA